MEAFWWFDPTLERISVLYRRTSDEMPLRPNIMASAYRCSVVRSRAVLLAIYRFEAERRAQSGCCAVLYGARGEFRKF